MACVVVPLKTLFSSMPIPFFSILQLVIYVTGGLRQSANPLNRDISTDFLHYIYKKLRLLLR